MLLPSVRVPDLTERALTLIAVELFELLGFLDTFTLVDAVDLTVFYDTMSWSSNEARGDS